MPPLRVNDGNDEFDRYKEALDESGRFRDFIQWKPIAREGIGEHLDGHTQASVEALMYDHRQEFRQVREKRANHQDYSYYYKFLIPIDGSLIFIETVFVPGVGGAADKIRVVSLHPQSD